MKKAKVILTTLLVLAVVGGGLAFKAKLPVYCLFKLNNPVGAITCPRVAIIETTLPGAATSWATTRPVLACPTAVPTSDCTYTFNVLIDQSE
ncbi:hypothetical protein [Niastella sp. OAS944]|uniref:hypothetical protein n=1 Tax=Niastella sp. OAS944 TaxID=2664089 RepID=UPI003488D2AD|nr:hypothetical protein [Chitinophagaceae bacterium OAS944]